MVRLLGIKAFHSGVALKHWWEWALVAISGVSVVIGVVAFIWASYRSVKRLINATEDRSALSRWVQERIHLLSRSAPNVHPRRTLPPKATSFGVYLGPLSTPVKDDEARILARWDAVVLDYREPGILNAVHDDKVPLGPHIIARLDITNICNFVVAASDIDRMRIVTLVSRVVREMLRQPNQRRYFTGVLLAGWHGRLSTALVKGLTKLITAYALDVFLEISPPDFLEGIETISLMEFAGVVVRNGTVMTNGERRDFFAMDKMKSTTKAFVSESCMRPFTVMMWDTVEDAAYLSHAVARRAHTWCSYHGALLFIVRRAALMDIFQSRSCDEPLAAFQWLKDRRVMEIHQKFRTARTLSPELSRFIDDYIKLQSVFPLLKNILAGLDACLDDTDDEDDSSTSTLTVQHPEIDENGALIPPAQPSPTPLALDWFALVEKSVANPLSSSPDGKFYGSLGCFPIGFDATREEFEHVLDSQRRLRRLGLLSAIKPQQLQMAADQIKKYGTSGSHFLAMVPWSQDITLGLSEALTQANDETDLPPSLKVYVGLDSGFHTPTGCQFWAIWEQDKTTSSTIIYVSKSAEDLPCVLLHTFLSLSNFSRYQCFVVEYGLSQFMATPDKVEVLPRRFAQDLSLLSNSELLLYLQHLQFGEWDESCPIMSSIRRQCEILLIEVPTYRQMKRACNIDYLSRRITEEQLVQSRVRWYRLCGLPSLSQQEAFQLFRHINDHFGNLLWYRDHEKLEVITTALERLIRRNDIDAVCDFVLFSIFCAARKAAFDEIYIEVSDRNPLFNQYTDQSAAFAELFALGSRCEAYFDITPSDMGVLLSKRHRDYYGQNGHEPPMWIFNAPSFASAYAAAQTDIDPEKKVSTLPGYRRFTFLSVFAIPSLIDILLLTTTGHGLYLSAYMEYNDQKYATMALMTSLLLAGAIGTWISIGGTYYLISMAFSAANMFVLTRLIGGLAFTAAGCVVGFVIIAPAVNARSGLIFLVYLFGLTSYLSVLALLSTYQIPGSAFLNGRKAIVFLTPTLIISPLLTLWIPGHDVVIYPCVLYVFVGFLTLGARRVGMQWVTWYHNIKTLNDADVKDWYIQRHGKLDQAHQVGKRLSKAPGTSIAPSSHATSSHKSAGCSRPSLFQGLSEPAILVLCRKALYEEVIQEKNRHFWQKPTEDTLVKQLAECWDANLFLLDWYSRITDTKRPIPFSSTWNLETQVALESMQQSQKGIKLHNSFIHWRNAGDEIGSGILYFLTALMDRWLDLAYGANLVGLSGDLNSSFRLSVGFSLAYYLIGAVLLDYKAQHLHTLSAHSSPISIESVAQIRTAKANDLKFRRQLYWKTLLLFLGVHVWALAVGTTLVWIFNGSSSAAIMFLAYVGAYTGLLLYQYNKIFSGPHTLMPLVIAVMLGFLIGNVLKQAYPRFYYNNVIALAVSTWAAAILSFWTAKFGIPGITDMAHFLSRILRLPKGRKHQTQSKSSIGTRQNDTQVAKSLYDSYNGAGPEEEYSQSELEAFVEKARTSPKAERFKVVPLGAAGNRITAQLLSCTHETLPRTVLQAFPAIPYLVPRIAFAWQSGRIEIIIVPMRYIVGASSKLRGISEYAHGRLTLFVASDSERHVESMINVSSNCQLITETLIRACCEKMFGIPHPQAGVLESIFVCASNAEGPHIVSECSKRSMPLDLAARKVSTFTSNCKKELLHYLCLGFNCDTQWDELPVHIRRLFLRRCIGAQTPVTNTDMSWINENVPAEMSCTIFSRMARYDLGAFLTVSKYYYFRKHVFTTGGGVKNCHSAADIQGSYRPLFNQPATSILNILRTYVCLPITYGYHAIGTMLKFFVLSMMADTEYQRELKSALDTMPRFIGIPATFLLTGIWTYSRWAMSLILPFFLYHGRKDIANLANTVKGSVIEQGKNRLVIRKYGDSETAFIHADENEMFKLMFYSGLLPSEPSWGHTRIITYDKNMRVVSREEYKNAEVKNRYEYDYPSEPTHRSGKISKTKQLKIPLSKRCVQGDQASAILHYNLKGHIDSGSYIQDGNLVRFKYHYRKNAKYDDELLRAEFILPHMSVNVRWCAPPIRHASKMERWIPTPRVYEATFVQGADVYESTWLYDHKFHPTITTRLNGEVVETPDMIRFDWLGVLKKPTECNFTDENPLLSFNSAQSGFLSRLLRTNIKRQEISTSKARSQLWKAWKKRNDLDGVVVRWVDEELLRKETLLRPYWRRRDRGSLIKAEDYLALHADAIMATSDLTSDISAWTPLAVRMSDLFSFGQGGDAVIYTRTKSLGRDTDNSLHVLAVDTGTWPNEGGGVSACRRDLINNLRTIKWHMVVESANDFGLPKHQTEENVESLKVIPLWGLDFLHPSHGMFTNKLDSEVDRLFKEATIKDIKQNFLPTLSALVHGARAVNMTHAEVKQATRALVNLNTYFQHSRHWKEVWSSDMVKDTWRKLWLADDMPNTQPPSQWFRTELPTLGHLDTALELWYRYLFIFSIPIPEKIPNVFQASHHSIWDHAISWRETNLYLSSAMCTLPPFIRNALLGLMKMTSTLILHHADEILPCADFFNPGWEVEIGSAKGQLTHRNVFRRKVDPIVNGIPDMQKFAPVTEIKTKSPTVTMLSHVWFAKDIKTALLAANIISNEWGFKDYKLDIYGALNKAPVYSSECQEILACKGLGQSVALRGTADPAIVLANTWLFLNSSVSEGLPLALGEAALTGAPVVCTDVGASLRVLTDPDNGKRYSEVVAPNDAYGLARAQINLLAMLDEWAQYAEDEPGKPAPVLPHKPSPEDVKIITQRMYDKSKQRRKLGMMARDIVQKSFGGERYLREHEQMLWIGKGFYKMLGTDPQERPPTIPGRRLSLRIHSHHLLPTNSGSTSVFDPQTMKMQHPRSPMAKHFSTTTSFSSVYMDGAVSTSASSSIYGEDWGPATPDSSMVYPRQEHEKDLANSITRPPRAFNAHANSARSKDAFRTPEKPLRHERENWHNANGSSRMPSTHYVPKFVTDPRSALMRQSVKPGSTRSRVRTQSHLNEVETAEYLEIEGRL